jgi:hypothetical protein
LSLNAKFEVSTTICGEVIARSILVAWELVSSLETAKGVIFERVSTSYLFQRIKLPIFPNFHAGIIICTFLVYFCVKLPHYKPKPLTIDWRKRRREEFTAPQHENQMCWTVAPNFAILRHNFHCCFAIRFDPRADGSDQIQIP